MYDVITLGSATEDIFVDTELKEIISKKRHFIGYPAGSKILVHGITSFTGGGGSNTAVSFSRLGLKTAYIGKLAGDIASKKIIEEFDVEGVDFLGAIAENERGAISIILDSLEHHRTILIYKGTNNELDFNEIENELHTRWFYFSSMLGSSFETQKRLARYADAKAVKIAYNPSEYIVKKGMKYVKEIIERTEVLVLNKEEAKLLLGFSTDKDISVKNLAIMISKKGPNIVCITDEEKGAYCLDTYEKKFYFLMPHDIKVVERTGAGDAFASGFVAGIIKRMGTEFALQLAGSNAESVIKYYGAKNKLLTWHEAIEAIANNPFKIKVEELL